MRILYITTSFIKPTSSAAIRNNAMVKGLIQNGHIVDVYTTPSEDMTESELLKDYSVNYILEDLNILRRYYSNKTTFSKSNQLFFIRYIKEVVKSIFFFPDIYKEWINKVDTTKFKNYDLIISSSDLKTAHFVAHKIVSKYNDLRWVQIWGDPWALDIGIPKYMKGVYKFSENKILSKADYVMYVSEQTKEQNAKLFPKLANKLNYVPRGYLNEIFNLNRCKDLSRQRINSLYAGSLGRRNALNLVKWVERNNVNINLNFCGHITDEEKIEFSNFNCTNVLEPLSFTQLSASFTSVDLFLFIGNDDKSTQIPGKLFDYLGTNIPILCILNTRKSSIYSFIRKISNCFVVTQKELAENLVDIALFKSFLAKEFKPLDEYSPTQTAKSLLNLI